MAKLKENWSSTDVLSYADYNAILEQAITIKNILEPIQKRNIQVGDYLYKGTKLYLEFPAEFYKTIINDLREITGNLTVIEFTENNNNHSIMEYYNASNKICTVSLDVWTNVIYQAYYDKELEKWVESSNPSDMVIGANEEVPIASSAHPIVTGINTIDNSAYQYIKINDEEIIYAEAGWILLADSINNLENLLSRIAKLTGAIFNLKKWNAYTHISYKDINRWSMLLNYAYEVVFEESGNIVTEDEELLITEDDYYLMTEGG